MTLENQFDLFEATDGYQALSVLGAVRPDVIVLDLRMPRMDGMDFIRAPEPSQPATQGHRLLRAVHRSGAASDPGVCLATKTADLKELWAALRSTIPGAAETAAPAKQAVLVEDAVWRD